MCVQQGKGIETKEDGKYKQLRAQMAKEIFAGLNPVASSKELLGEFKDTLAGDDIGNAFLSKLLLLEEKLGWDFLSIAMSTLSDDIQELKYCFLFHYAPADTDCTALELNDEGTCIRNRSMRLFFQTGSVLCEVCCQRTSLSYNRQD